jgi:hypothetical protein
METENENIQETDNKLIDYDIRKYMEYERIRRSLIDYPTELALFEISCILINNKIQQKNINDK